MIRRIDNTRMKPPNRMMGPLQVVRQLMFNLKLFSGWKRLVPPPPPYNYKAIEWCLSGLNLVSVAVPHAGKRNHCTDYARSFF